MRRIILLLLALVMCFSLFACNRNDLDNTTPSESVLPEDNSTGSTDVSITRITLTTENWKTYFQAEPICVDGDITEILDTWGDLCDAETYRFYYLPLKEEYKSKLVNINLTSMHYETNCQYGDMDNFVHLGSMEVTWGEKAEAVETAVSASTFYELVSSHQIPVSISEEWEEHPTYSVFGSDLFDLGLFIGYEYASTGGGSWGTLSTDFTNVQGDLFIQE